MAVKDWSTTAASNDSADAAINWLENQAPSTVNNSARAMMAEWAKWYADTNGTLATTGSANAYVAATSNSYAALFDGMLLALEANHTNTGAATLAVDGLTAKAIVENDGTALAADKITSGGTYLVRYDSGNDQFYLLNPDAASSSASPVTTRGDIIRGDASGNEERLAVGTSGQYLSSDGTDPSWANLPTGGTQSSSPASTVATSTLTATGGTLSITPSVASRKLHVVMALNCTISASSSAAGFKTRPLYVNSSSVNTATSIQKISTVGNNSNATSTVNTLTVTHAFVLASSEINASGDWEIGQFMANNGVGTATLNNVEISYMEIGV